MTGLHCWPTRARGDMEDAGITALQTLFSGTLSPKKIERVEMALLGQEQVDCPVVHRFGPNVYIREVFIPAGTISIGHYQKTEHLNIMLKGRVTMLLENGTTREVTAPTIFVSNPGRKIGYIHEDMVWLNVYSTPETDVEKLETMFLDKSEAWTQNNELQNGIAKLSHAADREDYKKVLVEFGFTENIARSQSENTDDQIPMPHGGYSVAVFDSPIEGKGLFATAGIEEGEIIAPARIKGMRTPAGRFTNHSKMPNAVMVKLPNGDVDLVATKKISGAKGGYAGNEITIDYRQALRLSINPIIEGGGQCHQ